MSRRQTKHITFLQRDYLLQSLPWTNVSLSPCVNIQPSPCLDLNITVNRGDVNVYFEAVSLHRSTRPSRWHKLCHLQPLCSHLLSVFVVTYPSATTLDVQNPTSVPNYRESSLGSSVNVTLKMSVLFFFFFFTISDPRQVVKVTAM